MENQQYADTARASRALLILFFVGFLAIIGVSTLISSLIDDLNQKSSNEQRSAMASVNKVVLIGNLGADPELRNTASGDTICNLRIATSDRWKDKSSGDWRESTEWHRVVLYRKLAEVAGDHLRKGSSIYLEGRLRTRKWTDKEGKDRYTTEIEGYEMKMLGGSGEIATRATGSISGTATVDPWNEPGAFSEPFDMDKIPF